MRLVRDAAFGWYSGFPTAPYLGDHGGQRIPSRAAAPLCTGYEFADAAKFQYFDAFRTRV